MKMVRLGLLATALLTPLMSGCINPLAGGLAFMPVQPWATERMEEKFSTAGKNDFRTPVMPPIRPGFPPPLCVDPPSQQQILRAMPRVTRGVPYVYEEFRDNMQFVVEKIVDKIDPPRFFPLVGPAQLHHCHYKCTVHYVETIDSTYPYSVRINENRVQVVYIDKDHLHLCVGTNPDTLNSVTNEIAGYTAGTFGT